MSTFESLPVELVSDILSETDISSLINVSCVSHRLRHIVSDPALNPWRYPILRNIRSGNYDKSLNHLSVRSTVPRQNWIEIISIARPSYLLFDATLPNLKDSEWEECFRRRFLPSWAKKKSSTWRDVFYKTLYRVWHRAHSSCTSDEAWTKYLLLHRNSSANRLESATRNFQPLVIFDAMKAQSNLLHMETSIRLVVQFPDVRILALGVLNTPSTGFSVNSNAWALLHPPGIRLPGSAGDHLRASDDQDSKHARSTDHIGAGLSRSCPSGQVRHPTPQWFSHENYPMYTPSGYDRRWVQPDEMEQSSLKWVGSMMVIAQLISPHTMDHWSDGPPFQDEDLIVGPGRSQYASLCWEDFMAIAPWMDELITKKLDELGLGHI